MQPNSLLPSKDRDSAPVGDRRADAKPVRYRLVLLLGLVLTVLNTGWIANSEMKTGVTEITISSLFLGVTFILFFVTLINLVALRLFGARAALNQAELMLLYSFLSMSSVVAGVGGMGYFTPFLVNAFWYANRSNGWKSFWHLLPPYIGPRDHSVLKGYYEGDSTFFRESVMRAWAEPLLVWGAFFLILLWITLCLASIVRRRWSEEEHLPFPIIALPLEMTREGAPIYKKPLLWAGFAIPAFLHSLNSLHSVYPTLPSWPINSAVDIAATLPFPWRGIGQTFVLVHPAGVGFGYLINLDMLFSLWFFYVLRKGVNLLGVIHGLRDGGVGFDGSTQFPYLIYQSWGAWVALGTAIVWQGRRYFKDYVRRAVYGDPLGIDRNESMSARTAVLGVALGFLALCAFVWSTGASWWLPPAFMGLYALIMLALTRIQAEIACPSFALGWIDPQSMIATLVGTARMSPMDNVHLAMLSWFNSDYRAAPMPHQLQSFVGQERSCARLRRVPMLLMLIAAAALVSSLAWDLQMYYANGAATARVNPYRIEVGATPWNYLQVWLQHPAAPSMQAWRAAAFGAAMTGLLSLLRTRLIGFPLSPLGYVIDTTWANDLFWLDMLIAWVCKALILRYGGITVYRRLLPFFLGLILGDFVVGALWSVIGALLHLNLFRTFAN